MRSDQHLLGTVIRNLVTNAIRYSPKGDVWVCTGYEGGRVYITVKDSGIGIDPDDLDPDATQVYGMPVFPYQGMYVGLPWIYHSRWMKYGAYDYITKPVDQLVLLQNHP